MPQILEPMNYQHLSTPIGTLRLASNGTQLIKVEFEGQYEVGAIETSDLVLVNCAQQMTDYFAGKRQRFELPLATTGTSFQQAVWEALTGIAYGQLRSYRDIAHNIGNPSAARAVGAASGRNPLPIVVPCHRVIGSNGSLTGFAGGLATKRALLQLETRRTHFAARRTVY
jgi:methylated-DNA-[protein]-cysteine S-methyltransferase